MASKDLILPNTNNADAFNEYLENAWYGIGDVRKLKIDNKMLRREWDDPSKIPELIVETCFNPEYMHFFCKYFLNLEVLPYQFPVLKILWTTPLPLIVATRGFSKSWLLAVYICMRMVLHQGCRIAVVGSSLRQSMVIFNYIEQIWENAPVLQDLCGGKKHGPKKEMHMATWTVGHSRAIFLPLGDGCVVKDTLITDNKGLTEVGSYFENIATDDSPIILEQENQVLTSEGFKISDEKYYNGVKDVIKLTTHKGFSLTGTHNHRIKVLDGLDIVFKRLDELKVGDNPVIDRTQDWHPDILDIPVEECYAMGAMIGDGCYVQPHWFGISGEDQQIVDLVNESRYFDFYQYDKHHWKCYGKDRIKSWLDFWNINHTYGENKVIPSKLMSASKEAVATCLSGLFDTDGTLQVSTAKGGTACTVSFTNTSKRLVEQMQYLLLKFGIISTLRSRKRNDNWKRSYELSISGENVRLFYEQIGFKLTRKQQILQQACEDKIRNYGSTDIIPNIKPILLDFCERYWKQCPAETKRQRYLDPSTLKTKKNITYDLLSIFLERFGEIDDPIVEKVKYLVDKYFYIDTIKSLDYDVAPTYDLHVPGTHEYVSNGFVSHNTRIRGQRANIVIAEEFASISDSIFEVVVRGFAATKSQGVVESYKQKAKEKLMRDSGLSEAITQNEAYQVILPHIMSSNQIVINGTANYQFNHFYKYYNTYKSIITSGGDVKKLKESFPDMPFDKNLDARDYAIVRVPYDMVPEGPMDEKILSQGRATMDPILFDMEYGCIFPADSDGFYLASWLHSATCPVRDKDGCLIQLAPCLTCHDKTCVMAIDPASEEDNFAIAIIAINKGHRGLIYMWTTNHKRFEELKRKGLIEPDINDYVSFCLKHIRSLLRRFNIQLIVLDKAGGGVTVRETLRDTARLEEGDELILDMDDENERNKKGRHILKLAEFSSDEWRKESHYGLRKDIMDKALVFPEYDLAEIELLALQKSDGYETLDDCYHEIEECKTETTMIKHSQSPNGTERWDVPEIIGLTAEQVRKKLKRDRFTALLMANWGCRVIDTFGPQHSQAIGTMVKRGHKNTFTTEAPVLTAHCRTLPNGRRIYC